MNGSFDTGTDPVAGPPGKPPARRASILLLCFRDRAYIDEAIAGALAQTVPCEILVSNDASDDGTYERACELAARYRGPHAIRVRRNERNVGVAAHLSLAVPQVSGAVVVMMAGDDVSRPDRVERLLRVFDSDAGVMAVDSAFEAIDATGNPLPLRMTLRRERFGLPFMVASGRLMGLLGATLAFRREVLERFGAIRGPIEDNALSLRAALLGECARLREPLVRYRQHPGSVSSGVFARGESKRRRYERTIRFYRGTAEDLAHCMGQLPLAPPRRRDAEDLVAMYRLEADMREALLDDSRARWVRPILRGLAQRGLRRKSLERALKLLLPRRLAGLG